MQTMKRLMECFNCSKTKSGIFVRDLTLTLSTYSSISKLSSKQWKHFADMMKRMFVIRLKPLHLQGDLCNHFMQCRSTFLDLLVFNICQSLVEDSIDSILTNDHRQAQKHLLLYTMIALHQQSYCSLQTRSQQQ